MPVRNGGRYLATAVASILDQTFADFELIVVDDRSDDGAIAALDRDDVRLRILPAEGQGVSAAFNTGFRVSRGEFIARMDADDIALPKRFALQLRWFEEHPEAHICGGCVELFPKSELGGGNRRYQRWLNGCRDWCAIRRELYIESPIPNPTAMFRREALERLGGYGNPEWPEDYDLFLRADGLGMKMGKPDPVVLRWREHGARLTRTDPRYSRPAFQAAKAHYLAADRLVPGIRPVIWGAGPGGRLFHDLLREQGVEVTGFLDVHPRRIGGAKRGLPVWPIERLDSVAADFVVVAVGAAGARAKIRAFLLQRGWVEGEQFLFVT